MSFVRGQDAAICGPSSSHHEVLYEHHASNIARSFARNNRWALVEENSVEGQLCACHGKPDVLLKDTTRRHHHGRT